MRRVLEWRQRTLGPNDADTLNARYTLANLLIKMEATLPEAEDHEDTLVSAFNDAINLAKLSSHTEKTEWHSP